MKQIDVAKTIDEARFNGFHWMVLFWCALIIIFDGYDLVIYGVVMPLLMKEWGLSPLQAGSMGSAALFGMMAGALFFGPLSDKIGRKKAITICVILFSGFTVLNGLARDMTEFIICRFIAGLGIGGVMPNVVALMSEYAPRKIRSTLVAIMFSGYSVGGMLSAGLGMALMPSYGWQIMFYIAGIPLLLLPLIMFFLPSRSASWSARAAGTRPSSCCSASSRAWTPRPATSSPCPRPGPAAHRCSSCSWAAVRCRPSCCGLPSSAAC